MGLKVQKADFLIFLEGHRKANELIKKVDRRRRLDVVAAFVDRRRIWH